MFVVVATSLSVLAHDMPNTSSKEMGIRAADGFVVETPTNWQPFDLSVSPTQVIWGYILDDYGNNQGWWAHDTSTGVTITHYY